MNGLKDVNLGQIVFVIILAIIILIIYYLVMVAINNEKNEHNEGYIDIKPIKNATWSRSKCNYKLGETMEKVLNDNNIKNTNNESDGNVQIPCGYDQIDNEIQKLNINNPDQRVHIIHNADHISAKDYLWNRLVISSGLDRAKIMMPNTYILNNRHDKTRLLNEHKPGKIYIMKKNIQRQEGLKITDSVDEIMSAPGSYVLAQELLQDPYVINVSKSGTDNRKINMRFYILVVCKNDNMDVYVFDDGFMYYTKESFKKNSTESGPNITTGYIDRWIYEQNPLTQKDFRKYLDNTNNRTLTIPEKNIVGQGLKLSDVVFNRIYNLLREVMTCVIGKACDGSKLKNNVSFQLFGADIAVNDQLWPTIMEINKGPSIAQHDARDGQVKRKCVKDMMKIVGAVQDNEPNGFIQIINKENNRLGKVSL